MNNHFNKASEHPVSRELAECIERMRDLLFREFGTEYLFSILGGPSRAVIAASIPPDTIIHAVTRDHE